ncbi:MAG: modified peptide precursor CbpA [Rhodospirillales bacterium RIFCSPLOWO2_12_FULL_58_28]|nr:MAG: modified peptide precursor CbpA [Rhodospirillales bacterium RIFCSPLOWO2_02_FULL_58_16]OHC78050.1 MAG: modified peptide precursor CbpA [Rhodospirillales bacterium RIFCSPLOWO2_12_FULL_58_28]
MTKANKATANGKTDKSPKDIIAYRKSCDAEGTGLSHYILMDKKPTAGKSE